MKRKFIYVIFFVVSCLTLSSCTFFDDFVDMFNSETYQVSFDLNGGVGEIDSVDVKSGDSIDSPESPAKENYRFIGWSLDESEVVTFPYKPNESLTLYALWELVSYEVTFDLRGGVGDIDNQTVLIGESIIEPIKPSLDGNEFLGWSDDPSVKGANIVFPYEPTENVVLYAVWMVATYTVSFDLNGGTGGFPSQLFEYDLATEELSPSCLDRPITDPIKEDYIFIGWSLNSESKVEDLVFPYVPTKDTTLYAIWEIIQYEVVFDLNGGVGSIPNQIVDINTSICKTESPTRENYNFIGWSISPAGETPIADDFVITNNSTLYAVWIEVSIPNTYNSALYYADELGFESSGNNKNDLIEISSSSELLYLLDWMFFYDITREVYFLPSYLDTSSSDNLLDDLSSELDSIQGKLTARTWNYSYATGGFYGSIWAKIVIPDDIKEENRIAPDIDISKKYIQQSFAYSYIEPNLRLDNYIFPYEKRFNELSVSTSDQLFYAFMYNYKPIPVAGSQAELMLNEAKDIMLCLVDDTMSDTEKLFNIYCYIVENVNYNYQALGYLNSKNYDAWYIEGVLNRNLAVCDGISKAFVLFAGIENITTIRVIGHNHAWNKVYIDAFNNGKKEWFVIDSTWANKGMNNIYEVFDLSWFLATDIVHQSANDKAEGKQVATNFTEYKAITEFNVYDFYHIDTNTDLWVEDVNELDRVIDYLKKAISVTDYKTIEFAIAYSDFTTEEEVKSEIVSSLGRVGFYGSYMVSLNKENFSGESIWTIDLYL